MKSISFIVDEYFNKTSDGRNRDEDARERLERVKSAGIQPTTFQKYIAELAKKKKEQSGE